MPVLCLGEQDVVGPVEMGYRFWKWQKPARPHPVHVVFGEVGCPRLDFRALIGAADVAARAWPTDPTHAQHEGHGQPCVCKNALGTDLAWNPISCVVAIAACSHVPSRTSAVCDQLHHEGTAGLLAGPAA